MMKKNYIALLLVLLLVSCHGGSKTDKLSQAGRPESTISFLSPMEHDFGSYDERVTKFCTFVYKNVGRQPLVIYQAEPDCGCTSVKFSREPLAVGKTDSIVVSYDGNGFLPGIFQKCITIHTNGSSKPLELKIKGAYYPKE